MEAAASLTTLIVLALQSTKSVYQTIDDIQDGPAVITTLVNSTKELESTLQQLLQLIQQHAQPGQAHDSEIWRPLQQKITECSTDMQETSDKLKALNPDDSKHRVSRAWRRLKVPLKEKFLARLDNQIQHHVVELGLQLHIVNRYVWSSFHLSYIPSIMVF